MEDLICYFLMFLYIWYLSYLMKNKGFFLWTSSFFGKKLSGSSVGFPSRLCGFKMWYTHISRFYIYTRWITPPPTPTTPPSLPWMILNKKIKKIKSHCFMFKLIFLLFSISNIRKYFWKCEYGIRDFVEILCI